MKVTDYLCTFVKESREKESRRFYRSIHAGVKIGFVGFIWFWSSLVVIPLYAGLMIIIFKEKLPQVGLGFALWFFGGYVAWFIILYIIFSVLLWWFENRYAPKRGIQI